MTHADGLIAQRAAIVSDASGKAAIFVVAALAALALAVPFSIWLAHAPADLTQAERLAGEIGCMCGTCPHRPIATCGCPYADGMLGRLNQEVAGGHTDDEIMSTFVLEYGSAIQIKPDAGTGVGLMAWLAPMALLMVGAVVMAGVISHWRGGDASGSQPAAGEGPGDAGAPGGEIASAAPAATADADRYRSIVERELDALDD